MRGLIYHPAIIRACELCTWWVQLVGSHGHHPGHGLF